MKNYIEIPVPSLRVGDFLQGYHGKDTCITSITIARGCGNFHVNSTMCYNRGGFAFIAVTVPVTDNE